MKAVSGFFDSVGAVLDSLAGVPPKVLETEVALVVGTLLTLFAVHASASQTEAVTALVVVVVSLGVAFERVMKAMRTPNTK